MLMEILSCKGRPDPLLSCSSHQVGDLLGSGVTKRHNLRSFRYGSIGDRAGSTLVGVCGRHLAPTSLAGLSRMQMRSPLIWRNANVHWIFSMPSRRPRGAWDTLAYFGFIGSSGRLTCVVW